MRKNKKYTYDNWWNGEVTLNYSLRVCNKGDEPIIVEWVNFDETNAKKIKEKQKEIFEKKVADCVIEIKSNFLKQFEGSLMKGELWRDEIQQCWDIMFATIPNANEITLKHWEFSFPLADIMEIQRYIKRKIKKGIQDGYDYIHSPNCKYQDINYRHPQVYAQFVWDYHQWLETNFTTTEEKIFNQIPPLEKELDELTQNESTKEGGIKPTVPNNKYPSVFKNGYAFEMFIELKDLTVKPTTILADYSFIFHKMKGFGYIGKDVKHKTFIDIINKKFDAGISAKKFAFKDQEAKKIVFSTLLNKYKPLIESIP